MRIVSKYRFLFFLGTNCCRILCFRLYVIVFSLNKQFVKLVHSRPLDWSHVFPAKRGIFKIEKDRPSARNVRRGRQRRRRAPTALPIVEVSTILSITLFNGIWKMRFVTPVLLQKQIQLFIICYFPSFHDMGLYFSVCSNSAKCRNSKEMCMSWSSCS